MRDLINIVESILAEGEAGRELAERIIDFLNRHAKLDANYDPEFDEEEAKFNGPDSAMFWTAAQQLLAGETPNKVNSSYGSGCYRPIADAEAKAEHDELVQAVNSFVGPVTEAQDKYNAKGLLARFGGKIVPYAQLPENAKKSITQYMIVDGENDDYQSQKYAYAEIPSEDFFEWVNHYFRTEYRDENVGDNGDWAKGPLSFKPTYPADSLWPVIVSPIGFEDGSHRLERYAKLGVKMIPVVYIA